MSGQHCSFGFSGRKQVSQGVGDRDAQWVGITQEKVNNSQRDATMSDCSNQHSPVPQVDRIPLGKLVAEFSDVRAGAFFIVGYLLGGLGIALAATELVLSGGKVVPVFGAAMTIVGTAALAIGKFRSNNRLLIYEGGVAQTRRWRGSQAVSWEEVLELRVERETRYSSGLAHEVRYHCSLRRKDGTRLALDAILVTYSAVKALLTNAPVSVLFGETNTVVDGRV
jgi:hypothetical protein